jgi:hypothetical protein
VSKKNKLRRQVNAMSPTNKAIWDAVHSEQWLKVTFDMEDAKVQKLLRNMGFVEAPKPGKPESWWRGLFGKGRSAENRTRRVVLMVEP